MSDEERQVKGESVLATVVDQLCDAARRTNPAQDSGRRILPSRDEVISAVHAIRQTIFPGYFGEADLHDESLHYYVGETLNRALPALEDQIARAIAFVSVHDHRVCQHCRGQAAAATRALLLRLPELRRLLESDVDAAFDGDPALQVKDEAIFSYPGLFAITEQRIAHELYVARVPLIPRIITEHAHSKTGIDIHPGAAIGERFFIDHGTGVVIGETSRIGRNVRLYQGVTLGAKSFPVDEKGVPIKGVDRHPILEDDVVVYAGATILGRITIGKGSSIGGNVWLTHGVSAGSRVMQAEPRETRFEAGGGI